FDDACKRVGGHGRSGYCGCGLSGPGRGMSSHDRQAELATEEKNAHELAIRVPERELDRAGTQRKRCFCPSRRRAHSKKLSPKAFFLASAIRSSRSTISPLGVAMGCLAAVHPAAVALLVGLVLLPAGRLARIPIILPCQRKPMKHVIPGF